MKVEMCGSKLNDVQKLFFGRNASFLATAIYLSSIALVAAGILYFVQWKFGILLVTDTYDMNVYYASSSWAVEGGRLYREVPSEYPLLANMIFAAARVLGYLVFPGKLGFYAVWIALAWLAFFSHFTA